MKLLALANAVQGFDRGLAPRIPASRRGGEGCPSNLQQISNTLSLPGPVKSAAVARHGCRRRRSAAFRARDIPGLTKGLVWAFSSAGTGYAAHVCAVYAVPRPEERWRTEAQGGRAAAAEARRADAYGRAPIRSGHSGQRSSDAPTPGPSSRGERARLLGERLPRHGLPDHRRRAGGSGQRRAVRDVIAVAASPAGHAAERDAAWATAIGL